MFRTPAFIAALALAACGAGPAPAMPARPPKPEAPAAADPAVLLVTPAAVGPATATTPFDREAIQRLFGRSEVSLQIRREGGVEVPVIVVSGPWDLHVEFYGRRGTLSRAVVRGEGVRGPRGEKAGDSAAAAGFLDSVLCEVDRRSRTATCRRPGAPQLGYVFDTAGIKGDRLAAFVWSVAP